MVYNVNVLIEARRLTETDCGVLATVRRLQCSTAWYLMHNNKRYNNNKQRFINAFVTKFLTNVCRLSFIIKRILSECR